MEKIEALGASLGEPQEPKKARKDMDAEVESGKKRPSMLSIWNNSLVCLKLLCLAREAEEPYVLQGRALTCARWVYCGSNEGGARHL